MQYRNRYLQVFFRKINFIASQLAPQPKTVKSVCLRVDLKAGISSEGLTDKQLWLQDNYPFISWSQLVFCGNKDIIQADIMIDDHLKNLNNFKGKTIIFTQPHNMNIKTRHQRVDTWDEIEKLLLNPKELIG